MGGGGGGEGGAVMVALVVGGGGGGGGGGVELFKILNKQERSCCNKSKAIKVTIIGILLHYVIQF